MSDLQQTITGEIIHKGDVRTFGTDFKKLELVVRTPGEYPQELPVEFHKDRADLAHRMIQEGDQIDLQCNLRGREWQGHDRWFVSLVCWRFDVAGAGDAPEPESEPEPPALSEPAQESQTGMPF